jgi:quinoprotein glucose dehydrogenase
VRAYDTRTGELRWQWDPVPQSRDDPASKSWDDERSRKTTGGANVWSSMTGDAARGLVFAPTSSPSPDYYGVLRPGRNDYGNSIVALDAQTGKVVWHFQTVHHDLWDYDNASPPLLASIHRDGKRVPVVVQATKTGQLFVLDRASGEPVYRVEELPVPASDVEGEHAWPTQPFTVDIAPLSPHRVTADDAWGPTPEDREACRKTMAGLRNDGIFTPPSARGTLVYPSNIGGAHWGGVAYDVAHHIIVAPVNRIAAEVQLLPKPFDHEAAQEESDRTSAGYEYNEMKGTPFVMRRRLLFSPSGLPCTPPPFGTLVAIDLDTGKRLWETPLGDMQPANAPAGAQPAQARGGVNLGGALVTAGGLVFMAGTRDGKLRAFDVETGRELWAGALPGFGRAAPMSYQLRPDRKQYVVVATRSPTERGGTLVAFALP